MTRFWPLLLTFAFAHAIAYLVGAGTAQEAVMAMVWQVAAVAAIHSWEAI